MERIARLVTKYPVQIIVAVIIITTIFGLATLRLERESDITKLLPSNAVSVRAFNEIDEKFGGADQFVVIIEDDEIFDRETMSKVRDITDDLQSVPGVSRVISLTNLVEIMPSPEGIEIARIMTAIPEEPEVFAAMKRRLTTDDKYAEKFVSRDGKATLILAKLFVNRDNEATVRETDAVVARYRGPEKIMVSGSPKIAQSIMDGITNDLLRLIPLIILLVALILLVGFRSWYGVLLPLSTVLVTTIWSMGLMALLGKPITVIGSAIPVLIISVGSAYGLHFIARYEEERGITHRHNVLTKVMTNTGPAILIAAATTAAGFASNIVSDITAVRWFGLITAFGILCAFALTVTFIPAVLYLMPQHHDTRHKRHRDESRFINRIIITMTDRIMRRKSLVMTVTGILLLIAALGYPRLSFETNPIKYFNSKSEIVTSYETATNKFGGAITIDLLFRGDLKDPELLKKIDRLQEKMAAVSILNKPYSIVDAVKDTNRYLNPDGKREFTVPDSRSAIAQYLLLLSLAGNEFIENLITSDQEEMLVSCRVATSSSGPVDKMVKEVKSAVAGIFAKEDAEITYSGLAVVFKDLREILIQNQIQSLLLALLVVFLMVLLLYRTWRGALFCMTPILLTLLLNFGVMGWFGISLDVATTLAGSIAVGIGIDYAVHFFSRFREEMRQHRRPRDKAIEVTLRNVGRPIIFNAASVALGFLTLLFSTFAILRNFGILIALTMLFASFGAIAIMPELIMIKETRKRKRRALKS